MTTKELFQQAMKKADAISKSAEAKNDWSDDDRTAFDSALAEAKKYKAQLEQDTVLSDLKSWSEAPDGKSAVKAGFAGEVLPNEGNQEGITEDVTLQRRAYGNSGKFIERMEPSGELYDTSAIGAKKLKVMKSGEYKDAYVSYLKNMIDPKRYQIKGDAMKILNEGSDQAGEFWVPPDMRPELVKKTATVTGIAQNCYTFPTGSDLVKFPKVVYTTDDQWTTGVRPTWTQEPLTADLTEATNPIAGQAEIPIYTAVIPVFVTRAQVEDNYFDLLGYLSQLMGETIGLFKDQAFVNGDGIGKPQGILQHPNATVAFSSGGMRVASGGASTYTWGTDMVKGLTAIEAALPPQYEANAKWYSLKTGYGQIRAVADTQGRPLWNINDQYPTFTNGYAPTLLGYPIVKDQFFPTLAANSYSLAFGDAMGYYSPQRVGITIDVLREVKALRDQYVVYARIRLGGQLVQDWRMKTFQTAAT